MIRMLAALLLANMLAAQPQVPRASAARPSLAARIESILDLQEARRAFWGIEIRRLPAGEILYARTPNHLFVPASNTKLFSTALAIARLGPEFRFSTEVYSATAPQEGRIAGDLRLVGVGDPSFGNVPYPYAKSAVLKEPLSAVRGLAKQLREAGITHIAGDVIGDDRLFPWEPYAPGWGIGDIGEYYGAPAAALTMNDNVLSLTVEPGPENTLARVQFDDPAPGHLLDANVRTGAVTALEVERVPGSKAIRVFGSIARDAKPVQLQVAVEDPASFAAEAFLAALRQEGVQVSGRARSLHREPGSALPDLSEGVRIAAVQSPPLSELVQMVNKPSQNLHAELLLRTVGVLRQPNPDGQSARQRGLAELKNFLTEVGVSPEEYQFFDGSGLSRLGLVSPAAVVKLLRFMDAGSYRTIWRASLPVGGQDGTLARRFSGAAISARISAKTGSLSHVSALSGYAAGRNGEQYVFSVLVNNFAGPAAEIRRMMDTIALQLVE